MGWPECELYTMEACRARFDCVLFFSSIRPRDRVNDRGRFALAEGLIIRNGRIIDPSRGLDTIADILIENGKVTAVGPSLGPRGATHRRASHDLRPPVFCHFIARFKE